MSGALTAAELTAFADEHLVYEIVMLFAAVRSGRVPLIVSVSDASLAGFFQNARVEVFVIHLRALIGFLFPDEYRALGDDITAAHYIADGESRWMEERGTLSHTLRNAKTRADKEVAHVTDRRRPGAPREKAWDMESLANELREILLKFVAMADPERLGQEVRAHIPREPL